MQTDVDRTSWLAWARTEAIVGSCPASHKSMLSGLRCYLSFAHGVLKKQGQELPPSLDDLLAYSLMFRCHRTFCNYLGYLRTGCVLAGVSTSVFDDGAIRRAKTAIKKRRKWHPRKKLFIQHDVVCDMVLHAGNVVKDLVMLYLATYIFLLRLPSEALPMTKGGDGFRSGEQVCYG